MLTVLGTTTVDIFVRGVTQMPERSDDEFSNNSLIWLNKPVVAALGGNGANAAYASAALGEHTRLWSALGDDELGKLALGWLKERNVLLDEIYMAHGQASSTTVVLTGENLERNSFHHHGPARSFLPHAKSAGRAGDWLLLTAYSLLPHWRGQPTLDLLLEARQSGVRVALDPGPLLGDPPTRHELEAMMPFVDVLLCNEFELQEISGLDTAPATEWALASGARAVVVKKGEAGALVCVPGQAFEQVRGFKVYAHGTVGAGDSFDSGFLYALSRGSSHLEAARFTNAVAALVVSSPKGILAAPTQAQVEDFLRKTQRT